MARGELSRAPAKLCLQGLPETPSHTELVSTGTNPALPLLARIPPYKALALRGSTPCPRPHCRRIYHPVMQRGWPFGFAGVTGKHRSSPAQAPLEPWASSGHPPGARKPTQSKQDSQLAEKKKPNMQNKSKGKGKRNKDEDAGINPPRDTGA